MQTPGAWPSEIREKYEAIRVLGKGGFASVTLARCRPNKNTRGVTENPVVKATNGLVAIKVAGNPKLGASKQERAYAFREIDILQAISHENIMKCLDYSDISTKHPGAMILVLSYSEGPNVDTLLRQGGALSTTFGRVVVAQLVDALNFLHYHAVVHRDIKPDNVVVTGALPSSQPEIWDNPSDLADDDNSRNTKESPDWDTLRKKWHVTLVDFGFARALTKEDVHQPSPEIHRENMDATYHQSKYDLGKVDNEDLAPSQRSQKSLNRSLSRTLTRSMHEGRGRFSTILHRQMSALGSPQFAAPEIRNKVHEEKPDLPASSEKVVDITNTISKFVADYGLLVDAYSLGCTIRYMMTGCPPHQSVREAIANQNNTVDLLCGMCLGKKKGDENIRKQRFRLKTELPSEVQRLIDKLTERDPEKRTSVRAARRYYWIDNVLPQMDDTKDPNEIQYLDFSKQMASQEAAKESRPETVA